MIEIRQAQLSDKSAIFDFLSKAYEDLSPYKYPERWEWQFQCNPFVKDLNLPIWLAIDDSNKIVGQICSMVEPLKINNRKGTILNWAVDLIVLPEYRDQKIGFRLTKAIYDASENLMALPMSKAFRHYMEKLGSIQLESFGVYRRIALVKQESICSIIKNRFSDKGLWGKSIYNFSRVFFLCHVIAWAVNSFVSVRDFFYKTRMNTSIYIKESFVFDQKFNDFWEVVSNEFDVIVRRDSEFLKWKYSQQPFVDYKVFTALINSRISGYSILRTASSPESNTGIIADLLVSPGDTETIKALLFHAVNYFKIQKVRNISVASSNIAYQRAFREVGFKKHKEMHPLLHVDPQVQSQESMSIKDAWFLGRSDHDWDQFPLG